MIEKKFIPLNDLFTTFQRSKFDTRMDKLTFPYILVIWISIIVFFGLIYYFFAGPASYLYYNFNQQPVQKLSDSVYFSFITATSTGFGDLVPRGVFKVLAIVEVIAGLLLLAFVTSKLVSIKQDIILSEIYDISFKERLNRLRSSLLLFRQHLSRIVSTIEDSTITKREISDIYIYISSYEDTLQEIFTLVEGKRQSYFTKGINALDTELIYNSILQSFEKLRELLTLMNVQKLEWKRDVTQESIRKCIFVNKSIYAKLTALGLSDKTRAEIIAHNQKVMTDLLKELE